MKILVLAILTLFSSAAHATVIYMDSDAASTTNNSGHATVNLSGDLHPNPTWPAALPGSDWISYGPTGDPTDPGYFSPPDGTEVVFTTTFFLTGTITVASLTVMADDFSWVTLNGHTLKTVNLAADSICLNMPVPCSTDGVFTFSSLSPYLVDGANTLSFDVVEMNGGSFGLDFAGSVTDDAETPEPSTLAFIGGGLIALAVLRRRK